MGWENDEWHRAVNGLSEMERAASEVENRQSLGMCGDPDDAND